MKLMKKHSRRSLLAGLGGAAAATALGPFFPLLRAKAAGENPTRLVVFMTPMGLSGWYSDPARSPWKPMGSGSSYSFAPGSILEPLTPFRDRLLVIDGLDNRGGLDSNLPGGHPVGFGTILTGGRLIRSPGLVGGGARDWTANTFGPSIDQFVAQRLGARSMELGVNKSRAGLPATYKGRMSFRGPAEPVPPDFDPASVFARFFGGLEPTPPGEDPPMRRQHILDHVREDLNRLRGRIGRDDRLKMDAHLAALGRLESELAPAEVTESCTPPTLGPGNAVTQITSMQLQLITSAFQCGLASVASVMFGGSPNNWDFSWLPTPLRAGYHELSHAGNADTAAQNDLIRANRWYAQQFRDFLSALDSVPEADGTMLDNTIVVWTSEVSSGNNHSMRNMPFVVAGGTNYFRTGQYVTHRGTTNQLWVSICQALGMSDVTTFGDPAYGSGPVPGLV